MEPESEITKLKNRIERYRAKHPMGIKAKLPNGIWTKVAYLSQSRPLKEVCQRVGLSLDYTRQKIKKFSKPTPQIPKGLIQLPTSPVPVLELTLRSGAVIKVFEQ